MDQRREEFGKLRGIETGINTADGVMSESVPKPEIVNFLLYVVMKIDDAAYFSFLNLDNSLYLFPFKYKVSKEAIMEDDRFTVGTFGGEVSVSLKE